MRRSIALVIFLAATALGSVHAQETTFPSRVQLKVLKQGSGPVPTMASQVELDYRVLREDGSVADSSAKRGGPAKRKLADTMPCFQDALVHVAQGSTVALFCPASSLSAPGAPAVTMDLRIEVDVRKVSG